ncbi:MAG: type transport system permease protein [Acidobacteriota bacterium]|jgi:ABC-2 type transport system permease protein|nr:type transport system permease protein [Acidobacteriota bacterium]
MRPEYVFVVLKREYLQRVKNKAFWIATLAVPLFAAAVTTLPSLLLLNSHTRQTLVVVDASGRGIGDALKAELAKAKTAPKPATKGRDTNRLADFAVETQAPAADPQAQRLALDRRVRDEKIDAWVWIGKGVLADEGAEYHARNTTNFFTQETLRGDLSEVVRRVRLQQAGIDPARMEELTKRVEINAVQVPGTGTSGGGIAGMIFAVILFFLLYMSILMWGQQVMQGVLEEKGTRVIEVLISSLTPFELMMGKLLGICSVGLTQLAIWLGTVMVMTSLGAAAILPFLPAGTVLPSLTLGIVVNLALLFILGFFAYATLYAAIGASFNNLQEAQQVASIAVVFIVAPVMVINLIINDPSSTMAVTMSLIPLFTPLIMPLRIAIEMPPAWQLALAYALTLSFVLGMIWVCSRIYRVGILMYGKKPTLKEILKWTRYA